MGEEGRKRKNLTAPLLLFSPARGEKRVKKNLTESPSPLSSPTAGRGEKRKMKRF
jgi:hypothetical protein